MLKKIIIIVIVCIMIFASIIICRLNSNLEKTSTAVTVQEAQNDNLVSDSETQDPYEEYYYFGSKRLYVPTLIKSFMWIGNYDNKPVTKKYINKFGDKSFAEYYNILNYDYNFVDIIDRNKNELEISCEREMHMGEDPICFRVQKYKYFLDEEGLLDDIEFVSEEVYRNDDWSINIVPNRVKFDEFVLDKYENLIYGYGFTKYRYDSGFDRDLWPLSFDEVQRDFNEYALTDNFKSKYNIYKGLLDDKEKEDAIFNDKDIVLDMDGLDRTPEGLPMKIIYPDKTVNVMMKYVVTDDGYLDDLKLVPMP